MVNRGEEKARVHMNVVPRSTKNTNGDIHMKNAALSWQQLYSFPLSDPRQGTRRPDKDRIRRILKEGIVIRGVISLGSPSYHKGI